MDNTTKVEDHATPIINIEGPEIPIPILSRLTMCQSALIKRASDIPNITRPNNERARTERKLDRNRRSTKPKKQPLIYLSAAAKALGLKRRRKRKRPGVSGTEKLNTKAEGGP